MSEDLIHSRSQSPSALSSEAQLHDSIGDMSFTVGVSTTGPKISANRDEWQVWGSRPGSPQKENVCVNHFGVTDVGPIAPHHLENEWTADTNGLTKQRDWDLQPGRQLRRSPSNSHPDNTTPLVLLSSEPSGTSVGPHWVSPLGMVSQPPGYSGSMDPHLPSPPVGPTYPAPFLPHSALLHRTGQMETQGMTVPMREDNQGCFRGMVVEDDGLFHGKHLIPPNFQSRPLPPHYPQTNPYNSYRPPEYGNYYITHPPEPFTDYSFRFDGFQGRPHYHIPHPNSPMHNNIYPHPYSTPVHNDSIPRQQLRIPFDHSPQVPAPPFFYSPNVFLSPPMLPMHPNVSSNPGNFMNIQNNQILPPNNQSTPRSVSPRHLISYPSPKIKRGGQTPVSTARGPSCGGANRQLRRLNYLPPSVRSPLLEDFRSNRDRHWDVNDIFGHILEFSGDQYGSRFIQQNLEAATDEVKQKVFEEIVPSKTDQLVRDVFGNYVIQKFFEFGTEAQIDILADIVERQVVSLSLHIYGCRVVQKAIDCIPEVRQTSIIRHLQQDILACIKDAHGNHVIQKLVEVVPPDCLTFLPLICDSILVLSTHPYGCRVLQRCLEYLPEEHTRALLEAIHGHTLDLMQDQYGNYVIQFIIEQGQDIDKAVVISRIRGNLFRLSQHKYASNVCEKALTCTDPATRHILINEIMSTPAADSENPILTMIKDQYANYVLQRALTVVEGEQREAFYVQLKPLVVSLRKSTTTYNRPLISKRMMDRYFGKQRLLKTDLIGV